MSRDFSTASLSCYGKVAETPLVIVTAVVRNEPARYQAVVYLAQCQRHGIISHYAVYILD